MSEKLPASKLVDRFRNFQGLASLVNSPTANSSARRGKQAVTLAFQSVSKVVAAPFAEAGADAFREYLSLVSPSWDAFVRARAESRRLATFEGKPVDFSEIPEVFLKSDYRVSGLLQHDILRQPLRRTVTYEERTHTELSANLEKVEMMLISHLANFDALLQSLESMSLLEQGIFSASEKIKYAREKIRKVKESKEQVNLHCLLRRKKRISKTLEKLAKIESIRGSDRAVQAIAEASDLPAAVALTTATLGVIRDELSGISAVKEISENLNIHAAGLDKFLENEFVEIFGKCLIPSELIPEEISDDRISKLMPALEARGLVFSCMQNSVREAALKRSKLRFKKFLVHFLQEAVGNFSDEETALREMSSDKFPGFWCSVVESGIVVVLEQFPAFAKIFENSISAESLQRIFLEISSTLTARAAALLQYQNFTLPELIFLGNSAEPFLKRNFQICENLSRDLRIPAVPPGAAG